ncbi:MAG: DUF4376 domain-containing protein [Pseudomonadota bacterium]
MKHAEFDQAGTIVGYYADDIHIPDQIPQNTISITDEEWSDCIHFPGKWMVDIVSLKLIQNPSYSTEMPIDEAKQMMWSQIKAERDRRKAGGFKVKVGGVDKWFHSDADSRIQHLGLKDKARDLLAAGGAMTDKISILGQPVKWKTMDGTFVEVTAQVAFDIVAAAGDLDAQLFAAAETHRAAMEASPDPASYDFSTGWPATFGG